MIEFLTWFEGHLAQWWQFLTDSKIPTTNISYAALILSLVALEFFLFIIRVVFHGSSGKDGMDYREAKSRIRGGSQK